MVRYAKNCVATYARDSAGWMPIRIHCGRVLLALGTMGTKGGTPGPLGGGGAALCGPSGVARGRVRFRD
jgi:hypothetical protein